jgi:hypothetical protein
MMCQACSDNRHYECGLQTWCECDCPGDESCMDWDCDDDGQGGHSLECTCETCIQNYPERAYMTQAGSA